MLEDIAVARAIPNIAVVVPADANEFMAAFMAVLDHSGPVYLRIGRSPAPVIFDARHAFTIGKATRVREGRDLSIVATGVMVARAIEAGKLLAQKGVAARVINLSTIKPIDEAEILAAANETGAILTAEDHNIHGGMGSAVAEFVAQHWPVPMKLVGIEDRFGKSGEASDLAEFFGLTGNHLAEHAMSLLSRKASHRAA
jgi:transketolase